MNNKKTIYKGMLVAVFMFAITAGNSFALTGGSFYFTDLVEPDCESPDNLIILYYPNGQIAGGTICEFTTGLTWFNMFDNPVINSYNFNEYDEDFVDPLLCDPSGDDYNTCVPFALNESQIVIIEPPTGYILQNSGLTTAVDFRNNVADISDGVFDDLAPFLYLVAGLTLGLLFLNYSIDLFKQKDKKRVKHDKMPKNPFLNDL